MWPFEGMSLATATFWSDLANLVLFCSLAIGALATFSVIRLSNVKEHHWDAARDKSQERIVGLEAETAKANAELGRAQADIAKANAEIAEARRQTAALEKEAAAARERTAEIERLTAWRQLREEAAHLLYNRLLEIPESIPRKIFFAYAPNDPESLYFTIQIARVFMLAKWDVKMHARGYLNLLHWGIRIVGPEYPNPTADSRRTAEVRNKFTAAGIPFEKEDIKAAASVFGDMPGPRDTLIIVGHKEPSPITMSPANP